MAPTLSKHISILARKLHVTLCMLPTAELVLVGYWMVILALHIIFASRIPNVSRLFILDLFMLVMIIGWGWGTKNLTDKRKTLSRLPVLSIVIFSAFTAKGFYIHYINPVDMEPELIWFDKLLLGTTASELLENYSHPLLTDFLQLCYSSYFFLPFPLFLLLYRRTDLEAADRLMAMVITGFVTSYLLYMVVPARSPYVIAADPSTAHLIQFSSPITGSPLTTFIRESLDKMEYNKRDCFPSGHTEVSLIILWAAWKYYKKAFWPYLVIIVGLISGTLYLRYHYIIDLIAGAALALLIVWLVPLLAQRWDKHRTIYLRPLKIDRRKTVH